MVTVPCSDLSVSKEGMRDLVTVLLITVYHELPNTFLFALDGGWSNDQTSIHSEQKTEIRISKVQTYLHSSG